MTNNQQFYDVDELHQILGGPQKIARGTLYNAVKAERIPCVKFGRRIMIPAWFVDKLTNPPASTC